MKIVFFGTPAIGAGVLKKLVESEHEVIALVTQPDRASGRGKGVSFSPAKEVAVSAGIKVLQPEKVSDEAFLDELEALGADLHVVAAYAQKLPNRLLEMAPKGCINVHPSLLPKYRGAAPLMAAILYGDEKSGVTIMRMAEKMDVGNILLQEEIMLDPKETTATLEAKATALGGDLLLKAIEKIEDGTIEETVQDDSKSSYVRMISKEAGLIDWNEAAEVIERKTRAYVPWPGTFTALEGKTLKIFSADVTEGKEGAEAGTIILADKNSLVVQTGDGALSLKEIQLEGKKRMTVQEFLRGKKLEEGTKLG